MDLVREHYAGFGPTLAMEKLLERHGLLIGRETLRGLMRNAGLWQTRAARPKAVQQPRARRQYFGELIQIDGSEHRWFEDRGPYCTVLTYVDDATSRLQLLRFVESESTFDYMQRPSSTSSVMASLLPSIATSTLYSTSTSDPALAATA